MCLFRESFLEPLSTVIVPILQQMSLQNAAVGVIPFLFSSPLLDHQQFRGRGSEEYLQFGRPRFNPWVGKIPGRRKWLLTPVFLPGEFHGQRSLAGYSPWGREESDTTEQLTLSHFFYFINAFFKKNLLVT